MTIFYDENKPSSYRMKTIFLDTGSRHIRPPQQILDFFLKEKFLVAINMCIAAERMISYAADIPLEIVGARNTKKYHRLHERSISQEIDSLLDNNIGDCSNYWVRRLIDVHRTSDPDTFPGLVIFGLDTRSEVNSKSITSKVLKSDIHGGNSIYIGDRFHSTAGIRYDAYLDPSDSMFNIVLPTVLNTICSDNTMMDVRPFYNSQPEYVSDMKVLQEKLKDQIQESQK